MAKIGIRLPTTKELRLVEDIENNISLYSDFIVYKDEEEITYCTKYILLPSSLVIERSNIKSVKFIRFASEKDNKQLLNKDKEEDKAYNICKSKINMLNLPMNLIDAVYTFDFQRLTFYYSSENRVDFRELLKELTSVFRRTRIILRQIGAREEAKLIEGVGTCGRTLCCSTWLKEFPFVSMKMAKNQNLPANPSKLAGVCGKLKCCLSYEDDMYLENKDNLPEINSFIETEKGIAQIIKHYPIESKLQIKYYENNLIEDIKIEDIKSFNVPSPVDFEEDFSDLDDL